MVYDVNHGGNNPVHARRFLCMGPGGAPWKKDPATKKCPEAVYTLDLSTITFKTTEDRFINVEDDVELLLFSQTTQSQDPRRLPEYFG